MTAYFDNNSTTLMAPAARQRMFELQGRVGNASSPHGLGQAMAAVLEEARAVFQAAFKPLERVIFTSGATEANALALAGRARVIVNELEHSSVWGLSPLRCRATPAGVPDLGHLEELLREGPATVSMMHVNNETGMIFPVAEAAALVRAAGGLLHVDVAQSLGKTDLAPVLAVADMITFSAHKFHGPLGVGGLACGSSVELTPLWPGGLQEGGVRSGTLNVPAIAAAAVALGESGGRSDLLGGLEKWALSQGFYVLGGERLWTTSCICFPGLLYDDLISALSARGVYVSSGSACSSRLGRSRVLQAMGLSPLLVESAVRFSISAQTSRAELETLLAVLPECLLEARERGPYGA